MSWVSNLLWPKVTGLSPKVKELDLRHTVQAVEHHWTGLDEPIFIGWQTLCLLSLAFIMDWRVLDSFSILYKENFIVKACCIRELVWKAIQITSLST